MVTKEELERNRNQLILKMKEFEKAPDQIADLKGRLAAANKPPKNPKLIAELTRQIQLIEKQKIQGKRDLLKEIEFINNQLRRAA